MSTEKPKRVRVTVTLHEDVYKKIKDLSHQVGLLPATWVAMTATSKVNHIDVSMNEENV